MSAADSDLWYLSFATDAGFLGGCVVEADDFMEAVDESIRLGINPGGQVFGVPVPEEHWKQARTLMNRLLSHADMVEAGLTPTPVDTEGGVQ